MGIENSDGAMTMMLARRSSWPPTRTVGRNRKEHTGKSLKLFTAGKVKVVLRVLQVLQKTINSTLLLSQLQRFPSSEYSAKITEGKWSPVKFC